MPSHSQEGRSRGAPPRFRLYGVGLPKTGTHSLAGLFGGYRSAHQPDSNDVIRHLLDPSVIRCGDFFRSPALAALAAAWTWEMNSSNYNYHLIPLLRRVAPEAGFVLTVREPLGWLASIARHESTRPRHARPLVWEIRRLRFRLDLFPHCDFDRSLEALGLFSVEGYLRYWCRHHANVLAAVPDDRLAVVEVGNLDRPATVARLAAFAGVPAETLRPDQGHLFASSTPFDLFDHIDRATAEGLAQEICGDLWQNLRRRAAA